jgi:hypothetical protein
MGGFLLLRFQGDFLHVTHSVFLLFEAAAEGVQSGIIEG